MNQAHAAPLLTLKSDQLSTDSSPRLLGWIQGIGTAPLQKWSCLEYVKFHGQIVPYHIAATLTLI